MLNSARLFAIPRWLLSSLVLFLVLGHACDLAAYVEGVDLSHPTAGGHHGTDADADESHISCEPMEALSSPGHADVAPSLHLAGTASVPARLDVALTRPAPAGSSGLPSRPPLFLLHASLLI